MDNSFFVEEAFNQEPGVVQNIFGFSAGEDGWAAIFTQEWPVSTVKHQLSYTIPFSGINNSGGLNDVLINYRYQALTEGPGQPAFAPRLSVILPSGDEASGRGKGSWGLQANLPFSKQVQDFYFHWNAGLTWFPGTTDWPDGAERSLTMPSLAGSVIWQMTPMAHAMFEAFTLFRQPAEKAIGTERETVVILSPGVRVGKNFGAKQLVLGLAVPFTWNIGEDPSSTAVLAYLSYELPFR